MAKLDEKGPMQPPRRTCDVMKDAPGRAPGQSGENAPGAVPADATTPAVHTSQEDA